MLRTGLFGPFCIAALLQSGAALALDLPVGDGRFAKEPQIGQVFSCETRFGSAATLKAGTWINDRNPDNKTWNPDAKPRVEGRVMSSEAKFNVTQGEDSLTVEGNGLPMEQPTGTFPVANSDPAFAFDPNPNKITARNLSFRIPAEPVAADKPGCLPMGMIGFTNTGVAIFSALDAQGRDAAAHEVLDVCDGHPDRNGQYHYHNASACLPGTEGNFHVGFALDGYPIFGMRDADDKLLTNEDLDACHGRKENVRVQGRSYDYAYRLTQEYPYTLGCFMGQVSRATLQAIAHAPPQPAAAPPKAGPKAGAKGPPPYGKAPPPPGRGAPRPY